MDVGEHEGGVAGIDCPETERLLTRAAVDLSEVQTSGIKIGARDEIVRRDRCL